MLTITLPIVLALSAPQEPKTTTQLVPLQHICTNELEQDGLPWGSLMRWRHNLRADLVLGDDGLGAITPDAIVEALYGFAAEAIDEERLFLQAIDNNLLVVGDPTLVARVRQHIQEAAGILARPMQVELAVWDAADREAAATILDKQAFAKWAANRSPLWRAVSTANAGQPLIIENMTWSRYVRGIEIEVAQKKAKVVRPWSAPTPWLAAVTSRCTCSSPPLADTARSTPYKPACPAPPTSNCRAWIASSVRARAELPTAARSPPRCKATRSAAARSP